MNLSDTQLVILSTAAQRDDLRILLPERLRGGAAEKVLVTLLGKGLIEPTPVDEIKPPALGDMAPEPVPYRIATAGLTAIGLGEGSGESDGTSSPSKPDTAIAPATAPSTNPPRSSSKLAKLIVLLGRPEGADLAELTAATEWLPHTTRAALSGLRKRGIPLERHKRADGTTVYAIPTASEVV